MLTRLQLRAPYVTDAALRATLPVEVTATFGLVAYGYRDDVVTVRRSYRRGNSTPDVDVNWSALGSCSVADARDFAAVLEEALAFAQQLRVVSLDNATLAARAEAIDAAREVAIDAGR